MIIFGTPSGIGLVFNDADELDRIIGNLQMLREQGAVPYTWVGMPMEGTAGTEETGSELIAIGKAAGKATGGK